MLYWSPTFIKSHCDCAPNLLGRILVPTPDGTNTVLLLSWYKPQCANEGASDGTHRAHIQTSSAPPLQMAFG